LELPLSVRDAQKLFPRLTARSWFVEERNQIERIAFAVGVKPFHRGYADAVRAELARLAQQRGPKAVLLPSPESESQGEAQPSPTSDREHQIGTDEVAEQSENPSEDSQMHGGDSASGEVESGTSEGGDNESGAPSADSVQTFTGSGTGGGEMGQGAGQGSAQAGTRFSAQSGKADAGEEPGESAGETGAEDSARAESTAAFTSPEAHTKPTGGSNGLRADAQARQRSQEDESAPSSQSAKNAGGQNALNRASSEETGAEEKGDAMPKADEHAARDTDALRAALTGRANAADAVDASPGAQGKESGDPDEAKGSEKISYRYRSVKRGSGKQASVSAKREFGGVTAELSRAGLDPHIAKEARRALARLIEGGESQAGPRWDWVEFSKRLKTARSVYPARKEEEGRPAILVLADVSGSCQGFSDESLIVAQAAASLGVRGADVIVVAHSNGYPQQVKINRDAVEEVGRMAEGADIAWYEDLIKRFDIQAVVALGDWDAEWLYHKLADLPRVRRFVWLDNWSNSVMEPTVRADLFSKAARSTWDDCSWHSPWHFESAWSPQAQRKATYVVGCSHAEDFVKGLELALRRK
jgi:hypothetical protein